MPFAQLLGDIVDAATAGSAGLVLPLQPAHKAGDGLVDPLDGDGGTALGRLEPGSNGIDRGTEPMQLVFARAGSVGIINAAAAAATVDTVGSMGAARQRREPALVIVTVFHDDGVQPLAQSHARATRKVLGDLARLGLYALHAPGCRGCPH